MTDTWIALGSNQGDRRETLARAVALLRERGIDPLHVSHLYETVAEAGVDEPPYLNGVLEARTELAPRQLLTLLQGIEEELGRPRDHAPGPRTCDLDILSMGDTVLESAPELCLPHPRLHRRSFVLVPLCEIDVHWRHPVLGCSAGDLLAGLAVQPGEVRLHGSLQDCGLDRAAQDR